MHFTHGTPHQIPYLTATYIGRLYYWDASICSSVSRQHLSIVLNIFSISDAAVCPVRHILWSSLTLRQPTFNHLRQMWVLCAFWTNISSSLTVLLVSDYHFAWCTDRRRLHSSCSSLEEGGLRSTRGIVYPRESFVEWCPYSRWWVIFIAITRGMNVHWPWIHRKCFVLVKRLTFPVPIWLMIVPLRCQLLLNLYQLLTNAINIVSL